MPGPLVCAPRSCPDGLAVPAGKAEQPAAVAPRGPRQIGPLSDENARPSMARNCCILRGQRRQSSAEMTPHTINRPTSQDGVP